jgi:hypothetical protein
VILFLAGCDALLAGLWLGTRPGDLLHFLQAPASPDASLLVRGLGALQLGYAGCLFLAGARPGVYRGLALGPLLARGVQCGLWLWLLGTTRVALPAAPLWLLLGHDGVSGLALALVLAAEGGDRWRAQRRGGG